MSNRAEYLALIRLRNNPDYEVLRMKWLYLISKIEMARDNAASKASEGTWKYYAGQEKGAKTILTALDLAIATLEDQDKELVEEQKYEALMKEARGEKV